MKEASFDVYILLEVDDDQFLTRLHFHAKLERRPTTQLKSQERTPPHPKNLLDSLANQLLVAIDLVN